VDAVPASLAGERPAVMVMESEFSLLRGALGWYCPSREIYAARAALGSPAPGPSP